MGVPDCTAVLEFADTFTSKIFNMRTSLIRFGQKFGQLATIRGVTKYQISPFEQKVFGGFFVKSTVNVLFLLRRNIFYFGPPTLTAYLTYKWVEAEHDRLQRKMPGEFDHET